MWFDSWSDIGRVVVIAVASYAALLLIVRVAGKRTLSQFNAYDFVVTVALGSILATILLSSDVSFVEGAVALAILATLQFLLAYLTRRVSWIRKIVSAGPTVVVRNGEVDDAAMRRHRLSPDDLRQAVRSSGLGSLNDVAYAILETDGRISVIATARLGDGSALEGL